jgi:hypothetical protein
MKHVLKSFAAIGALAAVSLTANQAFAGVIVGSYSLDSGTFGSQLGVHSTGSQSGTTSASGFVNQDGSAVTFTSTGLFNLSVNGQGEATIEGDPTLANLTISFAKIWGEITFDLETVNKKPSVMSLLVNGTDLFSGAICGTLCDLGNGSNKFDLTGPAIQTLTFNFNPAIADAKQFRLKLATDTPVTPETPPVRVPEPLTLSLFAAGLAGTAALRRRKSTSGATVA